MRKHDAVGVGMRGLVGLLIILQIACVFQADAASISEGELPSAM